MIQVFHTLPIYISQAVVPVQMTVMFSGLMASVAILVIAMTKLHGWAGAIGVAIGTVSMLGGFVGSMALFERCARFHPYTKTCIDVQYTGWEPWLIGLGAVLATTLFAIAARCISNEMWRLFGPGGKNRL
jgi:hypothetical protein